MTQQPDPHTQPTEPKVAIDLPQLEVLGLLEDGRLPLSYMESELEVRIPTFAEIKKNDILKLYIYTSVLLSSYTITAEDEGNPDFKARLTISTEIYPAEGDIKEIQLEYEHVEYADGKSTRSGKPVTVLLDKQPPGGSSLLRALNFTEEQKAGIDNSDLPEGHLKVNAYPWYGMEAGDVITPWVSDQPPSSTTENNYFITNEAVTIGEPGLATEVHFPIENIMGEGDRYFAYRLEDKLGNRSKLSSTVKISVNLTVH